MYSRVGRYYFTSSDARLLALNFYKELELLAQAKNYLDVPALMRTYGMNSGKMWLQLRDDMPASIAQDN